MKQNKIIRNLDVSTILHNQDRSTIEKLNIIPGLKTIIDKTVGNIMEKYAEIEYSSEGINVTKKSMPSLYRHIEYACKILDVSEIPSCSTDWSYNLSSFSIGETKRKMILLSGTIDLLNSDELLFVIGHELGHMKCGHKRYHMLTEAMYMPILNSDLKIVMNLIKAPLLNWYRISDYTADRMGLLCCQDIEVAIGTMIKMAGLPKSCYNQIHIKSFIQQAIDFNEKNAGFIDNVIKYLSINAASMPWLVVRAAELLQWYNSGEYDYILSQNKKNLINKYPL